MRGKRNNFLSKCRNEEIITEKGEGIYNMENKLIILDEGPQVEIHLDSLRATLKIYQTWKHKILMEYMDTGLKKKTLFRPRQIDYRNE